MAIERRARRACSCARRSLTAQQTTLKDLKTKLDDAQGGGGRPALRLDVGARRRPSRAPTRARRRRPHRRRADRRLLRQGPPARLLGAEDVRLDGERVGDAAHVRRRQAAARHGRHRRGREDRRRRVGDQRPRRPARLRRRRRGGDKLVLSSRATGAAVDFSATGAQLTGPTTTVAGRNAKYLLDGDAPAARARRTSSRTRSRACALTLKGVDDGRRRASPSAPPRVDREKVKTEIKAFVDAYNAARQRHAGRSSARRRSRTPRRRRTTTRARSSATPGSARCSPSCAAVGMDYDVRRRHGARRARATSASRPASPAQSSGADAKAGTAADRRREAHGDARGRRPGRPRALRRHGDAGSPRTSRRSTERARRRRSTARIESSARSRKRLDRRDDARWTRAWPPRRSA